MRQHQHTVKWTSVVGSLANAGACSKQAVGVLTFSGMATAGLAGLSLMLELTAAGPVMALPFAPNCVALEAYVNQVGRRMNPPVQVEELGDWYAEGNYVGCESGQVVRYLQNSTEMCRLYGERSSPYTAVGFIPSSNRLKIRTDRCIVGPPQPLPGLVTPKPTRATETRRGLLPWMERPTTLGALLLATGLAALAWSAFQFSRRLDQGEAQAPLPVLLQEEVAFLLDPPDDPPPPGTGTQP